VDGEWTEGGRELGAEELMTMMMMMLVGQTGIGLLLPLDLMGFFGASFDECYCLKLGELDEGAEC